MRRSTEAAISIGLIAIGIVAGAVGYAVFSTTAPAPAPTPPAATPPVPAVAPKLSHFQREMHDFLEATRAAETGALGVLAILANFPDAAQTAIESFGRITPPPREQAESSSLYERAALATKILAAQKGIVETTAKAINDPAAAAVPEARAAALADMERAMTKARVSMLNDIESIERDLGSLKP